MTPIIKGAIAAGTLASIGGATYASIHYLSPNLQISKLIDEEYKHLLLDTETEVDSKYWTENWENYKEQKGNVFNLAGWKSEDNTSLDLTKELKQKCSELKTSYVYSSKDDLYQNVTKYCGRWVTVADEAKKDLLVAIGGTEGTAEGGAWTKMVAEGEKAKWADDFKILDIKPAASTSATSLTAADVKKGCEAAIKKHKGENNYQTIYNSYKKVCVKQG